MLQKFQALKNTYIFASNINHNTIYFRQFLFRTIFQHIKVTKKLAFCRIINNSHLLKSFKTKRYPLSYANAIFSSFLCKEWIHAEKRIFSSHRICDKNFSSKTFLCIPFPSSCKSYFNNTEISLRCMWG